MGRISATIQLAKASWNVLKADRELLLLPIMSALATIVVAATFLVPIFIRGGEDVAESLTPIEYVLLLVLYLSLAFVTIFFNAALVHAANERLQGGDPTIRSALRGAASRAHRILPWALLSATVSMILRAVEERGGALGRIVGGIAGVAWSLVTFLVIPVLVVEDIGVGDAVKRSGSLFKRTWGENVAAQIGFGLLGLVASLPAVLVFALGAAGGGAVLGVAIVVAVVWIALVAVTMAALNGIFQTALYHYAVDGSVPGGFFPQQALSGAFAPRSRS